MKRYYAARHTHSIEFVYPDGWTVFVFDSKKDRDNFVEDSNNWDLSHGYNLRTEHVTREIARKIAGSRVKEVAIDNGYMLDVDTSYYNPHYWG
jgi:hypothetical protein